ncbi:MAG: hypothetical protein ACHQAY_02235 [Hyphomicrobiales bacterium]
MRLAVALFASLLLVFAGSARAQGANPMLHQHLGASGMPGDLAALPTLPGQDAFGAIQEVIGILEADPKTDWSRVDLEALRQHLTDMNEVTLQARAETSKIEGGIRVAVTGEGRTLEAIQRMVPAQARQMDGSNGWTIKAELLPNGAALVATSPAPDQAVKLRGLGFIGIMASGSHHQLHHLALAKGEMPH